MRSNSRSTITICIVLSIVTILCLITTSKAQKSKPSFIRFLRRYHKPKYQEEQQCAAHMTKCDPEKNECCGNLKCLNYLIGYCLYPLENCWCVHGIMYNTDNS